MTIQLAQFGDNPAMTSPYLRRVRRSALLLCAAVAAATAHSAPAAAPPAENLAYRVETGDTLIGLHKRLMRPGSDWRAVQRLNRVADPRRLQPGSTLLIPVQLLLEQALAAELLHVHGDVQLERAGQGSTKLAGGDKLQVGDTVVTGAQSSAAVRLGDGTRVLVRPGSRLRIERHVQLGPVGHPRAPIDSALRLQEGSADTRVPTGGAVKPRLEMRTPVANLGVRGTEFRTRVQADRTFAEVLSGVVAAGALQLQPGQGAVATATGAGAALPLSAAPDLGAVPQRVEQLPLQLAWVALPGVTSWRAQIFEPGVDGQLLLDGRFAEPRASWVDDLPDGRYELRVRAADDKGLEGRDAVAPFTLKARPEAPFRLRPRQDERMLEERVTLAWARNPAAAVYRLQIADAPDFATPRVDREESGTEATVELPLGTHHWRVQSRRADGDTGPWSPPQSFTREAPPPPPSAPAAKPPEQSSEGLMLRWGQAGAGGAGYRIQIARDADFKDPVADQTTQATEWLLRDPEPGIYHLRVQTLGADGRHGPFGAAQTIEVERRFQWWWLLPLLLLPLL